MTSLMLVGAILSFLGVALILGITVYYIMLPFESPIKIFLDTQVMGLSYFLYFVVIGAAISGSGLLLYIRGARTGIVTISSSERYRPAPRRALRRPAPPRAAAPTGPSIVEEIEKEIEEIVKSEEAAPPPAPPKKAEKKPLIEVVSRATDMVCPHCGSLNKLGSDKCANCGKSFYKPEDPSRSCPVCGAPLSLSQRISEELFVCGICFSELRVDPSLQKSLKLS